MNTNTLTHKLGFLLLSGLLFTITARAIDYTVIFEDDFTSNIDGWSVWNPNVNITHDAGNGEFDVVQTDYYATTLRTFPAKTLKREGDWISFSYDLRLTSPVDSGLLALNTVIGNSAGDAYSFMMNTGSGSGSEAIWDANGFGGSATYPLTGNWPDPDVNPPTAPEDSYFTVTGTITRVANPGQLLVSYSVDGTPITTDYLATDTDGMEFTYNRFAIGGRAIPLRPTGSGPNLNYSIDNVRVWAIPEPASLTLALMIAGAALLRRRSV